jgi:hypothetical protein
MGKYDSLEEREGTSNDLFDIVILRIILFVKTCRGKSQRSDRIVRLKTRKSSGGLRLRIHQS